MSRELDPYVLAGLLADMDRMLEQGGASFGETVRHLAYIERLDVLETIQLKLAFERRAAGRVN